MDNVKVHYDYKHYYPQLDIPHKEPVVPIEQKKHSKTTMRSFVALTRQIYNPESADKSYNIISKTSLQKDLKQFSKKAKSLIKEMHLQRVW